MPLRNLLVLIVSCVGTGLFVAACSSSPASKDASGAPAARPVAGAPEFGTSNGTVNGADRQSAARAPSTGATDLAKLSNQAIIYTASLSLRVKDVPTASTEAANEVAAAGGYVANEQQITATSRSSAGEIMLQLKIPVANYRSTLTALTKLGVQMAFSEQAQDVTQQVADVSSRVASAEAAIKQLRELLSRAGGIGSLLSVQDEINSQESSLESLLAQQAALTHETSYATVTVTFTGHHVKVVKKPKKKKKEHRGLVAGLGTGWRGLKLVVVWLLTAIGTLLPFAVPIVAIGGVIYVGRRRLVRRRTTPAPPAATS